jgi:integrase
VDAIEKVHYFLWAQDNGQLLLLLWYRQNVKVQDLDMRAAFVKITGKGGKQRLCPLWPITIRALDPLIGERGGNEPVFLIRLGHPITRFGIHTLVEHPAARTPSREESNTAL